MKTHQNHARLRLLRTPRAKARPKTRLRKPAALGFFQFALLRQVIQPGADGGKNDAATIMAAEAAFMAAGWTREEARAETRRLPQSREKARTDDE